MFTVLTIEVHEHGNTLIEVIECAGVFNTFEEALAVCTEALRLDQDVVLEFESAA